MADSLKIMMVGGRRAGKTSVLAGLIDSMVNGEVRNLLKIEDKTVLGNGQESLTMKIKHLQDSISALRGKTFLVDDSKTYSMPTYTLEFEIPGTGNSMTMDFLDVNGEFYEAKKEFQQQGGNPISRQTINSAIKEADVYIIAIDTPYLMEAVNPDNELCDEAINLAYNHIQDIQGYMTQLDDKNGADAKLVLFVPVKCEKWAHNGQINRVVERVKQAYATIIKNLTLYKNVKIDIIPVETAGAIEFKEHKEAYVCSNSQYVKRKCCLLDNGTKVRFANGQVRMIQPDDIIDVDDEAPISDIYKMLRPYSWFHITQDRYAPRNCEQVAYYILQFVLAKYLFIKEVEQQKEEEEENRRGRFWRNVLALVVTLFSPTLLPWVVVYYVVNKALNTMGTVSLEELKALVSSIESRGLIKQNVDGICNIKKSLLKI